jgi:hypothetical protein
MTSGSNHEKVGWRLPRCSGLLWSLLGTHLLFPEPSMEVGNMVPRLVSREVA